MKSTPEPTDSAPILGSPIRPAAPKAPDVVKPFEQGNHGRDGRLIADQSKALETIAETIRKKAFVDWNYGDPVGHIEDGQQDDWKDIA